MLMAGKYGSVRHAVASDLEGHQILANEERALIDRAYPGREFVNTGTRDLQIGPAVQRDVREHGLSRAGLAKDTSSHLRVCEIIVEVLDERPNCSFELSAADSDAVDQQVNALRVLDQIWRIGRIPDSTTARPP